MGSEVVGRDCSKLALCQVKNNDLFTKTYTVNYERQEERRLRLPKF